MKYLTVIETGGTTCGAYVPDVPGAVGLGADVADTLRSVSEALALHLEGEVWPEPKTLTRETAERYVREMLNSPGLKPGDELHFVEPATMNPVALEVTAAREAAGISQAELARRLGTARGNISARLENPFYWGHKVETLRRVADALNLKLELKLAA